MSLPLLVRTTRQPLSRLPRTFKTSPAFSLRRRPILPRTGFPFVAAAASVVSLSTMAPVPTQAAAPAPVAGDVHISEKDVKEPKAGGEKSGKMHSQVVIIGSGPAGHT